MNIMFGILVLFVIPLVVTYVLHRVLKSRIKVVVLLWVVNCIVFVIALGAELLIMRYYHARQAVTNINYDEIGLRYEPYYAPSTNMEKK